jgi:hypothetical protein
MIKYHLKPQSLRRLFEIGPSESLGDWQFAAYYRREEAEEKAARARLESREVRGPKRFKSDGNWIVARRVR